MPITEPHRRLAASQQSGDEASLLEQYRRFLKFRRETRPLIKGTLDGISVIGNVLSFLRTDDEETIYCAFNMGSERVRCEIDTDRKLRLMEGHGFEPVLQDGALEIPSYSAAFVQLG